MGKLGVFYDRYHQKNHRFSKVIQPGNFTYFYTLRFLQEPYLKKILQHGQILDMGCGVGALSLYFASMGAKVTGWDISPRAIELAEAARQVVGLDNVTFKVAPLKPGHGDFDLAICSEVIEHVADDADFAQRLFSQVKPGGYLFLSTPSSQNVLYRLGWYRQFDQEVGHLRRYTPSTISSVLTEQGWDILKLQTVEGPLRNLLFTTKLGFLIKGIRGPLIPLFHKLDQVSAVLAGAADIQVLARKPKRLAGITK